MRLMKVVLRKQTEGSWTGWIQIQCHLAHWRVCRGFLGQNHQVKLKFYKLKGAWTNNSHSYVAKKTWKLRKRYLRDLLPRKQDLPPRPPGSYAPPRETPLDPVDPTWIPKSFNVLPDGMPKTWSRRLKSNPKGQTQQQSTSKATSQALIKYNTKTYETHCHTIQTLKDNLTKSPKSICSFLLTCNTAQQNPQNPTENHKTIQSGKNKLAPKKKVR